MIRNEHELRRSAQHEHVLGVLTAGIAAAHPRRVIEEAISLESGTLTIDGTRHPLDPYDRLLVIGGGKPAGAIAEALESVLGDQLDGGCVVTDAPTDTRKITALEGSHPVPTKENIAATEAVLAASEGATEDDLVLVVVGGGASALLCAPVSWVSLEAYRRLTTALLHSGVSIEEFNAVRKHLSKLKGGRLARTLAPATVVGLVFSDVVGNRLEVIGSGPTAPDSSTYTDALDVLERSDVDVPESVSAVLEAGRRGDRPETPTEGDPAFDSVGNHILADGRTALDAARDACEERGYSPVVLSARIEGEARDVGRVHAAVAQECLDTGEPGVPPAALLSGGETTVTVTGDGSGGPNQEFALAAALDIGAGNVVIASVDTDGTDGATDVAGAVVDATTVDTARDEDDAWRALGSNDACRYLDVAGCLVETGPTGTNVNDLRVALVGNPETDAR